MAAGCAGKEIAKKQELYWSRNIKKKTCHVKFNHVQIQHDFVPNTHILPPIHVYIH